MHFFVSISLFFSYIYPRLSLSSSLRSVSFFSSGTLSISLPLFQLLTLVFLGQVFLGVNHVISQRVDIKPYDYMTHKRDHCMFCMNTGASHMHVCQLFIHSLSLFSFSLHTHTLSLLPFSSFLSVTSGTLNVLVYTRYWVINRTEFSLVFLNQTDTPAAGQSTCTQLCMRVHECLYV